MSRSIPLFLFVATLFATGVRADDKPKPDLGKLRGDWKLVAMSDKNNHPVPDEELKKLSVTIDDKGLSIVVDGKPDALQIAKVEDGKIDFQDGSHMMLGIYKLDGDTLEIAISHEDLKDRPTDLKPGEKQIYLKLKK